MIRTPALVLRADPFGETSMIATLLTRDMGRVRVMAKGIRRRRPGEACGLDLLTYGHYGIYPRRRGELHLLGDVQPFQQWAQLRERLETLYAAFFWIELGRWLGGDEHPDPPLFRLFVHGAAALDGCQRTRPLLDWLVVRVLALTGAFPRLDACAGCKRPTRGIDQPSFSLRAGGLVCPGCRPAGASPLGHGALAVIGHLLDCERAPRTLELDPPQQRELGGLWQQSLLGVLRRPLRLMPLLTRGLPSREHQRPAIP